MGHFIVSHNAALALLAHIPNPRFGDSEPEVVSIADACALCDQEAQEFIDRYDLGIETLDLLVPSRADRRRSKHVKTHLCTNELPAGSFISLATGEATWMRTYALPSWRFCRPRTMTMQRRPSMPVMP